MPDWHASFLDFFFLTSTVAAKNSNILILKWNGKMQWILNGKVAKFCFSLVHNVTLPVACFGCSEAFWLSFTYTISFPPSHLHTWPFVSPTHPRVLALLVSSLKTCGHTATYTYPIMNHPYTHSLALMAKRSPKCLEWY